MNFSFLHTMESNVALFALAADKVGWSPDHVHHAVRADLRQVMSAQPADRISAHAMVHETLRELAASANVMVVTCATLGPAVDTMGALDIPVIRADAALAEAASRAGKHIAVLCAVEATIAPNRALFERYASRTGATVTVRLIPDAWARYQDGQHAACTAICAQAAQEARDEGFDVVAYAHPWMAAATALADDHRRPLDSVQAAMDAARAAIRARGNGG
ncbi:arylsulfatase [Pseudomonadota bacterium AL_CKDN230030165-1A_HGKHYDSX7]